MALKMVELEQLKESAAKQKLDTENRKIKWVVKNLILIKWLIIWAL